MVGAGSGRRGCVGGVRGLLGSACGQNGLFSAGWSIQQLLWLTSNQNCTCRETESQVLMRRAATIFELGARFKRIWEAELVKLVSLVLCWLWAATNCYLLVGPVVLSNMAKLLILIITFGFIEVKLKQNCPKERRKKVYQQTIKKGEKLQDVRGNCALQ